MSDSPVTLYGRGGTSSGGGGGGAPSGPAGGVLGGTYPNPGFAVDMATQAELDAAIATAVVLAPAASARNVIQPTADIINLSLRQFSGQTADALQVQSTAGTTVFATLSASGQYRLYTTSGGANPTLTTDRNAGGAGLPGFLLGAGGASAADTKLYRVSAALWSFDTGKLTGGTNYATAARRVALNLAANAGFAAMQYEYPAGGNFLAGEVSVLGTNDIFFQALPATTAGYGYLEAWAGAGMVLGTGNATPVLIRPNRSTMATFDPSTSPVPKMTVAGTGIFSANVNGLQGMELRNATTGAASEVYHYLYSDVGSGGFELFSSGWGTAAFQNTLALTAVSADLAFLVPTAGKKLRVYVGGSSDPANLVMTMTAAGQLALPFQGSAAGIIIGGDTQIYRSASAVLSVATSVALQVRDSLQIGTSNSFAGGTNVLGIANASVVPSSNPAAGGVLYSESAVLKWRDTTGRVTNLLKARDELLRSGMGYTGETGPKSAIGASGTVLASGDEYGAAVGLFKGDVVTNILFYVSSAISTITTFKVGLWDSTGTLLASSANSTTNLSIGITSFALSAPFTITADGLYYIGFVVVATTPGSFAQIGGGITGKNTAIGTGAKGVIKLTGQTDIGSIAAGTAAGATPWLGWS